MRFGRGRIALAACTATLIAGPGAALGDSIEVAAQAGREGPSSVVLSTGFTLSQRSFVGSVLSEGSLASCAPNYAAGAAASRSATVVGAMQEQPEGALGVSLGAQVVIPGGTWSLCGWVQPGGPSGPPSAASPPVVFTIGGPQGTTSIPAPPVFGQEQPVSFQVAYALTQPSAQFPGSGQATVDLAVASAGNGCPGNASTDVPLNGAGPLLDSRALTSPGSGTLSFGGRLAPGAYALCAWLIQTFPQTSYGTLAGLLPTVFGVSTQTLTVLPRPLLENVHALLRRERARGALHLRYSLNVAGSLSVTLERIVRGRGRHVAGRVCARNPTTRHRVCGRAHTVGTFTLSAPAGASSTRLGVPRRELKPGTYIVMVRAENAAHEAVTANASASLAR